MGKQNIQAKEVYCIDNNYNNIINNNNYINYEKLT